MITLSLSKAIRIITMVILLLSVSNCAVYPNRFKCSDARGAPCTMLRDIDRKIDSGEIEESYKDKKKKCSAVFCSKKAADDEDPLPEEARYKTRLHIKDAMDLGDDAGDLENVYF